jgi:hypothetical protein
MYLQHVDKLIHEGIEKVRSCQFLLAADMSESPIAERDKKWTESGVVQFHHQL